MQNLKNTTLEQKEILNNAESILYTFKNELGNFMEAENFTKYKQLINI